MCLIARRMHAAEAGPASAVSQAPSLPGSLGALERQQGQAGVLEGHWRALSRRV